MSLRPAAAPVFAALGFVLASPASADLLLTGDYDSATTNPNQIDTSATQDPNADQLSLTSFETLVETAFAAQTGGVATFDNPTDNIPDSGNASQNIAFSDGTVLATFSRIGFISIQSGGGGRTPISGSRGVGGASTYGLDFNQTDQITAVGLTLISRAGNGSGDATVTATFVDAQGNNPQQVTAVSALADSNAGDDTFFGFSAPAGTFLTQLDVSTPYFTYLDDLGLVTGPVPEPGSLGLLSLGALALLPRRRPCA